MTRNTDIVKLITEAIQDKKGKRIVCLDLSDIETAAASNFIICEGTSSMQVSAIADNIRDYLLEQGCIKPYNYDGYKNSQWIVLDYGDTLVHVFSREMRELYNLEELWSDAASTEIPDID